MCSQKKYKIFTIRNVSILLSHVFTINIYGIDDANTEKCGANQLDP